MLGKRTRKHNCVPKHVQYAVSGEDEANVSDGGQSADASEDPPSEPEPSDSEADMSLGEDENGDVVARQALPSSSRQAARAASRAAADAAKVKRAATALARQAKAKSSQAKPARKPPAARPRAVPQLVKQHKATVWSDSDDESPDGAASGAATQPVDFRHLQLKDDHNSRFVARSMYATQSQHELVISYPIYVHCTGTQAGRFACTDPCQEVI